VRHTPLLRIVDRFISRRLSAKTVFRAARLSLAEAEPKPLSALFTLIAQPSGDAFRLAAAKVNLGGRRRVTLTALFAHVRPTSGRDPAARLMARDRSSGANVRLPFAMCSQNDWGTSGGTLRDKDQEIRVRTGKFGFWGPRVGDAPNGMLSKVYVENKGFNLAPQVGFEPLTNRQLFVSAPLCSPARLLRNLTRYPRTPRLQPATGSPNTLPKVASARGGTSVLTALYACIANAAEINP
jgi:hypothetical protein